MKKALSHATGLEARFESELAAEVPEWREAKPTFSTNEVRHNGSEHRFELETDGQLALADYHIVDGCMVITHTFVPEELRGRKLAERLITTALDHARQWNLKVVPQCSYVEVFLRRHPEFADLRAE